MVVWVVADQLNDTFFYCEIDGCFVVVDQLKSCFYCELRLN